MSRITKFEYAPNWGRICRCTHRLQHRCTQNPLHGKASIIHHLKYTRSPLRRIFGIFLLHFPRRSVSGFEIPGWDIVTVCDCCHSNYYGRSSDKRSVHHPSVWRQTGGINNRQTWGKTWELRIKFWLLAIFRI
ncbi:MAG: hypothetical protein V7L26_11470 [Nostoc sp.]|uniref:hypothetical protein n=1 Tax=Nostoc sp. TaxID=1180 RepID=UPI002FF3F0CF